jgi:hypothetical protein
MAIVPAENLPPPIRGDEQPASPLAGTRSQSMQRLQIGLFGLAAMILLVSLANIILTNAQQNEARVVPESAPTVAADVNADQVSDPLADAGVVPDMPDQEATADPSGDDAPALQP